MIITRFDKDRERDIKNVPLFILFLLAFLLGIQIIYSFNREHRSPEENPLPRALDKETVQLFNLGEDIAASRLIMLWLQAFDNQPGISIPFRKLDYSNLVTWLQLILSLDQKTQYPLLAASRIYSLVPDEMRQRKILDFVYQQFFLDPDSRWPSLAHATYVAKHKLKDLELALKYANALSENVQRTDVPFWVKQMNIYVLEDMGEIESAKVLLGGLISSGAITDPHELEFLTKRLKKLEQGEL